MQPICSRWYRCGCFCPTLNCLPHCHLSRPRGGYCSHFSCLRLPIPKPYSRRRSNGGRVSACRRRPSPFFSSYGSFVLPISQPRLLTADRCGPLLFPLLSSASII